MKKIIALLSAMILATGSLSVVSAREFEKNPDGTLKRSSYDVVLVKRGDSTKLRFVGGWSIVICDTEPTEEEMFSNGLTRYWVDCEEPYLIYYDLDKSKIVREDFELCISYIDDEDENKVYDYETNEELGYIRDPNLIIEDKKPENLHYDEKLGSFVGIDVGIHYTRKRGDINNDRVVDINDLSEFSLMILDREELIPIQKKVADVDGDGEVTLSDLARMRQYVSKRIDIF